MCVITYPCLGSSQTMLVKESPGSSGETIHQNVSLPLDVEIDIFKGN